VHGEDDPSGVEGGEDREQLFSGEVSAVRIVGADVRVGVEE
jgi:hypothetical protein